MKVFLHGPLKEAGVEFYEVAARTAAQALEILSGQIKSLRPDAVRGRRRVQVRECPEAEDLYRNVGDEIHVIPAMKFGKDNGVVQIVVGAVLIVAGMATGQVWASKLGAQIATGMIAAGIGMIVGGLITMIAPQPSLEDNENTMRSRYLGAPGNTVRIGTTVPLLLGRRRVGGHFLSLQIDAKDALT
jgi:predicted phage tail protein